MKTVIITGADGFIGRHFCKSLIAKGYEVYALIIQNSDLRHKIDKLPGIHILECDFTELNRYADKLPRKPLAFVHLAWAGVSASDRDDYEIQKQNIDITIQSVRLAAVLEAQKFIMPGSTNEYMYNSTPISGHDIPTPQNIYGATKIAARYLAETMAFQSGLPFVYTIFTGVYAADRRDGNVIFYVINCLLDGKSPELTKLEQKWDYIYIDDLIDALILICEKGIPGKCYPVGHGDNMPLYEYVKIIHQNIAPHIPLMLGIVPYKKEKLPQSCVDIEELRIDTGYVPNISFEKGIVEVIESVKREREKD